MLQSRRFDITLLGATGYTGKLVAAYLAGAIATPSAKNGGGRVRWALAGRNREKLQAVANEIDEAVRPEVVLIDVDDEASTATLAENTRVLCTTAGPFDIIGRKVVRACAENGTHYCDITGEVPFVRHSIDTLHELAGLNRARIVHCCGFDSIPSDIGVHLLQNAAFERFGAPLHSIELVVLRQRGGFSGGTAQSMIGVLDAASRDPEAKRSLLDPYGLSPRGTRGPDRDASTWKKSDFPGVDGYVAPFFMGPVNARVVRRTNALADQRYGEGFRYTEWMRTGSGAKGYLLASSITVGMGALFTLGQDAHTRKLLARWLPKGGAGPTKEEREAGLYRIRLFGKRDGRPALDLRVEGDLDPGYGDTAKMLGESALSLAYDVLPETYGVLTPAIAMGTPLAARLRSVNIRFELDEP